MNLPTAPQFAREYVSDRVVLLVISVGLITILMAIIAGIFGWFESRTNIPLPNWAENVLVSIGTAAALKLGDCLAALIALSSGKSVERLGTQLGQSAPVPETPPAPADAIEAAEQVGDAATEAVDNIKGTKP